MEIIIKVIPRKYETKKQVIGEDADLEKIGRILNPATPCTVERKDVGGARSDESKGEDRCGQGQTQTKHEWDGTSDGDDRERPQMTDDDASDSQGLTGGDITRYRALVARISFLSQDRPDLKFAAMQVCCAMANPSVGDMECVKRIGRYLAGKPRAKCVFKR